MATITLQATENNSFSFVNWAKGSNKVNATNIQQDETLESTSLFYPSKTQFSDEFYNYFVDYSENNLQVVKDYINQNLVW